LELFCELKKIVFFFLKLVKKNETGQMEKNMKTEF